MRRPLNLWPLLAVLVCAASIWAGRGADLSFLRSEETDSAIESSDAVPEYVEEAGTEPVHLSVLNGTERRGLARDVGLLVARAGCVAEHVGNAPDGTQAESILINRRLPRQRAEALSVRLGGLELLTEWDERCTEDAVLVLGRDHQRVLDALGR